MSRPNTRTRNPRGAGTRLRQEIVQAAAQLLDEGGSAESVTLRNVARRVGISAPSIYAHFADRESILLAVVQDGFSELERHILTVLEATEADATTRLRAICAAYLEFALKSPQRYRILFAGFWNITDVQPSVASTNTVGQKTLQLLIDALRDCVKAGQSSSTDPALDAVALWVALHGAAQLRTAAPLFPWPPDLLDLLMRRLGRLH